MRTHAVMVLATGLLLGADQPKGKPAREIEKFQGTWRTASMIINGKKVPDEALENRKVIITDNKYVVIDGDRTIQRGIFLIDPTKSPKQIDTIPAVGPNQGETDLGIYEFEGDTLRICHAPPGAERPAKFAAEPGSGQWFVIDRKLKPK